MSIFLSIIILGGAILLQGLFAGYETGFVSANPIRVRHLAEEEKRSCAIELLTYIKRPDRMLTTLLIGTNLAVVTATIDISRLVAAYVPPRYADLVATIVAAPLFLICSEIIPKSIFRAHPTQLSLMFLPLIRFFYFVLSPLAMPVTLALRAILRLMGEATRHLSPFMSSLEDVRLLVDEGADQGTIPREEQEMIHSVIDLKEVRATEIMVPRINIQALPENATREEALAFFEQTGKTRIPIYHETTDQIIGVINVFELLTDNDPEQDGIGRYVREVLHVPDSIRADELLARLRREKQHMAIIVDEYGGTDGLVTIEDIVEEIFGEIHDEYDEEERMAHRVGPNAYVFDARASLEDASQLLGVQIRDEEVETVGGWLMHASGRIPLQGEIIEHGRFRITVLQGGINRVDKVRLELLPETNSTPATKTKDELHG